MGDSVELHPLTVMFSVLIWTLILGGLIGALLAVPLTAAIKVLYKRYIWQNASMRPMTEPVLPPEHPGEQPPEHPRRFGPRLNSGILPTALSGKL